MPHNEARQRVATPRLTGAPGAGILRRALRERPPVASVGTYLAVAAGSAVGGVARYGLSGWIAAQTGATFPWGTLAVNVSGSLLIGFIAGLNAADGRAFVAPTWRDFLMAGVCGGYTTFSAFSLQTLDLLRAGDPRRAGANAVLSLVLCLTAVWLGHSLGMALHRARGL